MDWKVTSMNLRTLITDNASSLEPREFQIATMMARGKTNQEIATELSLAYKTIKNNCSRIWPKLGVFDGTHAKDLRRMARAEKSEAK